MNDDAVKVFADAVSANVAHTASVTNQVIENERAQTRKMAQGFLWLWAAVERSAEVVTTRDLEAELRSLLPELDLANEILAREDGEDD